MLIQLHMLQNYAPANLNRDDTGSPKDAMFGGWRRGRISSQCLKRSIRKSSIFSEQFAPDGLLAVRTKALPELVRKELETLGVGPEATNDIVTRLPDIIRGSSKDSNDDGKPEETTEGSTDEVETRQLVFLGQDEVPPLAKKLLSLYQDKGAKGWAKMKPADINKALGSSLPRSVDVAMFGRMTTSSAFEDVQAAVQVAHALSANALAQEFDYYTAVDDLSGESGAGMIGDIEFNSSLYYKFFSIHWEQLVQNLGGDVTVARRAVLALLEAAAKAQPSGKQNSFAAHNLPDLVFVEVREENLPVSYANAFVKPVRPTASQSLTGASCAQLADYIKRVIQTYDLGGTRAFTALDDIALPQAERQPSLKSLGQWLATQLPEA